LLNVKWFMLPLLFIGVLRYKYLRHPSYTGWFYFTIGTQILLGNPLTTIGYGITGLNFFQRRIKYEEYLLSQQYPGSYAAYCDQTYIGIPFLSFWKNMDRKLCLHKVLYSFTFFNLLFFVFLLKWEYSIEEEKSKPILLLLNELLCSTRTSNPLVYREKSTK